MSLRELEALFARAGVAVPATLAELLADPGRVPPWFRAEVLADPARIVGLNETLREQGFFGVPWPGALIALGDDPAGNVWFTDTRDARFPVHLANHELLATDDLLDLSCAEPWGESLEAWLGTLAERNAEIERESPYAVFAAGEAETEALHGDPGAESLEAVFWSRARPYCELPDERRREIRGSLFGWTFAGLDPSVSFGLADDAAALALRQATPCALGAALDLLARVTDATRTTEMPPGLGARWEALRALVRQHGLEESAAWKTLGRHYRRPP